MDLQEKQDELIKKIQFLNTTINEAKEQLREATKAFKEYGKLIEKAKALEQLRKNEWYSQRKAKELQRPPFSLTLLLIIFIISSCTSGRDLGYVYGNLEPAYYPKRLNIHGLPKFNLSKQYKREKIKF